MDLNIRYARTADGVRIAFATAGEGLPVVRAPFAPFSHCQLEWRQDTFFDRLSRGRMVIPFDPRGTGLSDRDVEDYSLEARSLDVDAVVAALGVERFALHGIGVSGGLAIYYATRHPERVSHLILDDAFADGTAWSRRTQNRALSQLSEDWEAMTENIAFVSRGLGGAEARDYARYLRSCTTPEAARRMWQAASTMDVTDLLAQVSAPTLILQHQSARRIGPDDGREMAMLIPNARLIVLEGNQSEVEGVLAALADFFGDAPADAPARTRPATRAGGVRIILFTDVEGHTSMLQRLGDEGGRAVLREHERITRDVLKAHDGHEVKAMGDGFMASFDSATAAVECAIRLQQAFDVRNATAPEPLRVRVGINAGEPIAEDDDLFGAAVAMAARIMSAGDGGEVLVSDVVHALVAGKGFLFADRGVMPLKGFDDPVRIDEARWQAGAAKG